MGELDRIRAPLVEENRRLTRAPGYHRGEEPHVSCTRVQNRMRITPVEAKAIAFAFRSDPHLRKKLPDVLERLERELRGLHEGEARQSFDCPLLDGRRCLVHDKAKPVGCLAWHPADPGEDHYTSTGWSAFEKRDRLNDRFFGRSWKLRVIPLWLKRVFAPERRRRARRQDSQRATRGPRRSR